VVIVVSKAFLALPVRPGRRVRKVLRGDSASVDESGKPERAEPKEP